MRCLYILEINPLLLHLQRFSPVLRVLFVLFMVLFVYFCFYFPYFIRWVKENFAVIYFSVLPMFFSKKFVVSGLTFRSLCIFEFTSVYGGRKCSNFILLHVTVQFF